ncbi:MAG: hypothetical protein HRU47_09205 [Verrucomicrobiales bacterium]|nr:hypothetical protein [Verrucomicrobiales bacterium]
MANQNSDKNRFIMNRKRQAVRNWLILFIILGLYLTTSAADQWLSLKGRFCDER